MIQDTLEHPFPQEEDNNYELSRDSNNIVQGNLINKKKNPIIFEPIEKNADLMKQKYRNQVHPKFFDDEENDF